MTNQEASKVIKDGIDDMSLDYFDDEQYEALTMAIQALEQNESAEEWYKLFVEKLEQGPKWIPVSERLPKDKTYVLTTIKVSNRIAHARSGWYEGGFFYNDNGDTWKATDMEVKAWMPLPRPYEPQESEDKE